MVTAIPIGNTVANCVNASVLNDVTAVVTAAATVGSIVSFPFSQSLNPEKINQRINEMSIPNHDP
jgi:hypothetical protein